MHTLRCIRCDEKNPPFTELGRMCLPCAKIVLRRRHDNSIKAGLKILWYGIKEKQDTSQKREEVKIEPTFCSAKGCVDKANGGYLVANKVVCRRHFNQKEKVIFKGEKAMENDESICMSCKKHTRYQYNSSNGCHDICLVCLADRGYIWALEILTGDIEYKKEEHVPYDSRLVKDMEGIRHNKGKGRHSLVLGDFKNALNAVVAVGTKGADKYEDSNWLLCKNGKEDCKNSAMRHLLEGDGINEEDFGELHLAHAAWNALAALEHLLRESNDNDSD